MESQETTQTQVSEEKGNVSAPAAEPKDKKPTTGIPLLDWLLTERSHVATEAAIYAALHICQQNPKLASAMEAVLRSELQPLIDGERSLAGFDAECDILPAVEWLDLLCGFETGSGAQSKQANEGTALETERHCTEEKAGPELKAVVHWLLKRNHTEKLAAVLASQLIRIEHIYQDEQFYQGDIGNDIDKDWENDIRVASGNEEFLKQLSPEDVTVTILAAALIPIPV